ncbi:MULTISPECIES: CobW family GTP-binding protein [Pseudanabaena]|uniref:Cobalamin synthesis protein P47K n=2 Tax=Pseudanabaena TaxID=1152 RepID=L8MW42_9CYAN|nr:MULTISPECIES: GTP-binding protein [Pseudanabaena]ELS32182.1 cobalamin synthesis protein P47K [Pseudanabaena biceps PCC 7429]MDG3495583.1 GTP-binding protein [Pseudanabaena catenata USMAC16]
MPTSADRITTQEVAPEAIDVDIPKRGMPVTIITGFLGSGKTTLLNHILQNQQDLKVAVLVNEFGDINIDSQLLISVDENMMELSNGCICCTINDGLVDAVYKVLERGDRIDYMIVETTGVADPLPIALTFLGTELQHLTRLDSILTVVDSEAFTAEHFNSDAAYSQIMYGDIIILNKTDLVSETKLQDLETYINQTKTKARILRSQLGVVPLPLILDIEIDQSAIASTQQASHDRSHHDHAHHDHGDAHTHEHCHDPECNHEHHHHEHHHHSDHLENDGFISISFQSDRPFDLDKFQNFLDKKLPIDVFRAKGILNFANIDNRYVFQLSGKRYELKTDDRGKSINNQLVIIGRNLHREELLADLGNCLV